jgi:hypothetical protein
MNCKPNDLALVVFGDGTPEIKALLGIPLQLSSTCRMHNNRLTWDIVGDQYITFELAPGHRLTAKVLGVADRVLKPLSNLEGPDEMLRIAGHPLSASHRKTTITIANLQGAQDMNMAKTPRRSLRSFTRTGPVSMAEYRETEPALDEKTATEGQHEGYKPPKTEPLSLGSTIAFWAVLCCAAALAGFMAAK